jgi:hypothetical protein
MHAFSSASLITAKLYSAFQKPLDYSSTKPVASHFIDRGLHIPLTPLSAIASTFDGLLGIRDGIKFILKGASNDDLFTSASVRLSTFGECLSAPFRHVISILNKDAKFYEKASLTQLPLKLRNIKTTEHNRPYINIKGNGFITDYLVYKILKDFSDNFESKNNIIAAKLIYAIMIPTAIVTRIIDLAIGIFATLGAFCTFGTQASINHLAFRGLQITGIFYDLFYCTAKLVNLNAGRRG